MSTGTEDFEKLRKLLKLKRHEQPPPGYFSNFSSLVINRIENEGGSEKMWVEVPWLKRFFGMFESSPVFSGLFGAALCGLVIFGISAANHRTKTSAIAFSPPGAASVGANGADSLAFNAAARPEALGRSTDPMFAPNVLGSPFAANGNAPSVEPVSFSPGH